MGEEHGYCWTAETRPDRDHHEPAHPTPELDIRHRQRNLQYCSWGENDGSATYSRADDSFGKLDRIHAATDMRLTWW